MSALRRLERGGYAFELTPGGNIAFHYAWPDEPPAAWADPLLALLRQERDESVAILRAREQWLAVYDEWARPDRWAAQVPAGDGTSPPTCQVLARLALLAAQAEWPCYDGAGNDLGAAGRRALMSRWRRRWARLPRATPSTATTSSARKSWQRRSCASWRARGGESGEGELTTNDEFRERSSFVVRRSNAPLNPMTHQVILGTRKIRLSAAAFRP